MDLKKWFSNNKWILLVLVYIVALVFQYTTYQWGLFLTPAGISLSVALVATLFSNSRSLKTLVRKIKFFFGFGLFKWEAQATITVRASKFDTLKKQEETLIELLKEAMKNNDIKLNSNSVDPSYDKLGRLKLLVEKYVAYFDISLSDLDEQDDDGFAVKTLTITTKASLRYKDSNKAINGILLDFYHNIEHKYNPVLQKYTVTIEPVDFEKNFMKKHFINELVPDDITSFQITCKSPRVWETINDKNINFVTNRREELNQLIKNAILRLS